VSGKEYLNFIFYRRVNRILSFYKLNLFLNLLVFK